MFVIQIDRVVSSDGLDIPNGEKIKDSENKGFKYLEILEFDKIRESEMKESFRREYLCRINEKNKIRAMNT